MERINEIASRIQSIQAKVEHPPAMGAFQSMLHSHMTADGRRDIAEPTHAAGDGPAVALDRPVFAPPPQGATPVTIGVMIGGPEAVSGVGSVGGVFLPNHHVPAGSVMTSSQLSKYMTTHDVEARNGRLDAGELAPITGSWNNNGTLLPPAAQAWELMRAAAARDGVELQVIDAYRSWESQNRAHQAHLAGEKKANVLPPGTSRHGAGLAIDVTNGHIIDRSDNEWRWMEANARTFGWHPISNETWHWEFRGV